MLLELKENITPPALAAVRAANSKISNYVIQTPMVSLPRYVMAPLVGPSGKLFFKLETFQRTGTFKARAAYYCLSNLSTEQKKTGVVTMSGGNHALAVAEICSELGLKATLCMSETVDSAIINKCKSFGAELLLSPTIAIAKQQCEQIAKKGKYYLHPFDGEKITTAIGSLALEINEQVDEINNVLVSVGGGGLAAAIASTFSIIDESIKVIGVEPEQAATMSENFVRKAPQKNHRCNSIATTLSPPASENYSYQLCQKYLNSLVQLSEEELIQGMSFLFEHLQIAVEPAGAATTAAICSKKLQQELWNQSTVVIVCGSNISYSQYKNIMD